jgi:hypothetical protein
MKPIDNDTLQAFVDGELDAATAARIDAALANDEVLARRVRQARDVRTQLRGLFDPVLDEPVPERLSALLQPPTAATRVAASPLTTPAASRHETGARGRRASRRWLLPGAALAASIAALTIGLWWHAGTDLVRMRDGHQFAAGALSHALDRTLASAPNPAAPITIGLTFRSVDGHICRTFVERSAQALAGLACHEASGWSLPVLAKATGPGAGELRQAGSELPPEVQVAVDARIYGDAFDAQQERAARDRGWR